MRVVARVRVRDVFTRSEYRRLWAARTTSQWGDVFASVALALLVLDLTGSGLGVVPVVVAEILPVLLLAPVAGAVVDRLPRVTVMVAADLVRAVLAAALVLLHDQIAAVYVVAVLLSSGAVFFNPPPTAPYRPSWPTGSWLPRTAASGARRCSVRSRWRHWRVSCTPSSARSRAFALNTANFDEAERFFDWMTTSAGSSGEGWCRSCSGSAEKGN